MINLSNEQLQSVAEEVGLKPSTIRRIVAFVPGTFPLDLPEKSRQKFFIPTTEMHDALMDLNDNGDEGVTGWHVSRVVRTVRNYIEN